MPNDSVLIVSFYLQWGILLALCLGVITLFKKHLAFKLPMKHHGLAIDSDFPIESIESITEERVVISGASAKATLFIMTSIGCGSCERIYPSLNKLHANYPHVQFILSTTGTNNELFNLAKKHQLALPVTSLTTELMDDLETSIYPFAFLVSPDGKVLLKGGINSEDDIKLILENDDIPIFYKSA